MYLWSEKMGKNRENSESLYPKVSQLNLNIKINILGKNVAKTVHYKVINVDFLSCYI